MVLVSSIIGVIVLAWGLFYATWLPAVASDQPGDDVLESMEQEQAENAILDLASNVPEVKALTGSGYSVNTDVVKQEGSQIVTKSVLQKGIVITGDYRTGYTLTFSGTQEVTSVIEDGKVISTSVTEPHDAKQTTTYTEEQIRIIDTGISVPSIKEYLAEHIGDTNVHVGMIPYATGGGNYDCPKGGCAIVVVQNFETRELLRTLVNPETNQVLYTFEIVRT